MQREVIKFNGKPAEIELAQSTGKPGENDYGPYYTYALAGNKVMFATEALNEIIQSKKPYPGMRLAVQLMAGNKWDVRPVDPPAALPIASTSPELSAPATPQPGTVRPQSNTPVNGNGWTALRIALFSAIDDAAEAEKYAAGKGMSIRFEAVDIRTMANTTVIGMQGGR
jgi:hypothetical protein